MDYPKEVLRLVREVVGAVAPEATVFDGQPAAKLEDRPERHVIVDISVPVRDDTAVADSGAADEAANVSWRVRVIVRSGKSYTQEDAAWAARWLSKKIRDHLRRRKLRPGGGLIEHEAQTGMSDDQAIVSHTTFIQVSSYSARV